MQKKSTFFVFSLFFTMLLLLTSANVFSVQAQGDATVIITTVNGGTTDITGTTTYPDGTSFNITATPGDGYVFIDWIIATDSGSTNNQENPLTATLSGGTTYTITPEFDQILAPPGLNLPSQMANAAIVVVLAGAGGTTSPAPGTYAVADATSMKLTATANSGWQFVHWTISGSPTTHGGYPVNFTPTDNPYTVGHGYGYTYFYQAVFTPVGTTEPTTSPTPTTSPVATIAGMSTDTWIIIGLIVVIIVMAIGFVAYAMRRKK
jgi:hypothetical protein